jgi:hypothetical protein
MSPNGPDEPPRRLDSAQPDLLDGVLALMEPVPVPLAAPDPAPELAPLATPEPQSQASKPEPSDLHA